MKGELVILAVMLLLVSMVLLGVSDSKASVAGVPDAGASQIEVGSDEAEAEDPPSSSATITITMYAVDE